MLGELRAVCSEHVQRILSAIVETADEEERAALRRDVRQLAQLHNRVGSIARLADTMTWAHQLERKAFGISEDDGETSPLDAMSEAELLAEVERLSTRLERLEGPAAG